MARKNEVGAVLGVVAMGLLVGSLLVGQQSNRKSALEQVVFMRPMQSLATFPGGMPDTGHSGRANNEEDLTDPYGGGDVEGPYGRVNDPYDGDWALNPLGGKARTLSNLRMMPTQPRFAPRPMQRLVQFERPMYEGVQMAPRASYDIMSENPANVKGWQGTNAAFMGSNGGGYGLKQRVAPKLARRTVAKAAPKRVTKGAAANKAATRARKTVGKQVAMRAHAQMLYRSEDPHLAEYGLEGDNILDNDTLMSDIGSNGAVIGVDGKASQEAHEWVHRPEAFSFACDPTVYGCETGLTVEEPYASD